MTATTSATTSSATGRCLRPFRAVSRAVFLTPFLLVLSCSESPTEPPSVVTLRVTNSSCASGECSTYEIILLPKDPPLVTPGGPWYVEMGTVSTASACLTFPASASFGWGQQESEGVKVITWEVGWTPRDAVSIGVMDAGFRWLDARSSTDDFVPTKAGGWSITVPGGSDLSAAEPCES